MAGGFALLSPVVDQGWNKVCGVEKILTLEDCGWLLRFPERRELRRGRTPVARCSGQRRGAEQAEGDVGDGHVWGSPAGPQLLPVNNRHVPQKELLSSSEEHGYFPPCRLIKESADNFRIGR